MKIELNIGLNAEGNLAQSLYRQAIRTLHEAVVVDLERTFYSEYQHGSVEVREMGLFVAFEWKASASELFTFIGLLSVDLKQDCIAVYCPDTDGGALVGPKATEWGFFNKAFFKRFNEVGEIN